MKLNKLIFALLFGLFIITKGFSNPIPNVTMLIWKNPDNTKMTKNFTIHITKPSNVDITRFEVEYIDERGNERRIGAGFLDNGITNFFSDEIDFEQKLKNLNGKIRIYLVRSDESKFVYENSLPINAKENSAEEIMEYCISIEPEFKSINIRL